MELVKTELTCTRSPLMIQEEVLLSDNNQGFKKIWQHPYIVHVCTRLCQGITTVFAHGARAHIHGTKIHIKIHCHKTHKIVRFSHLYAWHVQNRFAPMISVLLRLVLSISIAALCRGECANLKM